MRTDGTINLDPLHTTALLERAEELAGLGSWAWSPETNAAVWSDNLFRLFGLDPQDVIPCPELVLLHTHPDDRGTVTGMIEQARREEPIAVPVELRIVRLDGTVRHLRVTAALEDPAQSGSRWFIGTVHDVTDQRDAERQVAAHDAVTSALAGWPSFESGARTFLRDVATALGFEVGTLWMPRDDVFVPRLMWNSPAIEVPELEQATLDSRIPLGMGLPGRAGELQTPIQRLGSGGGHRSARCEAAIRDGLRAAVAFPALHGDRVMAVVEFHSRDDVALGERLLESLERIGARLAAFLLHSPEDLQAPRLSPREQQVVQLAAEGMTGRAIADRLVLSPATVKTHFEHAYDKLGVSDRAAAVAVALRAGIIE
jgi:PAS domain S-box-containing protein